MVSPQVKVSAFAGFLLLYWKSLKELSITCAGTTIVSLLSIESEILDNRSSYFSVGHVCVVLHKTDITVITYKCSNKLFGKCPRKVNMMYVCNIGTAKL